MLAANADIARLKDGRYRKYLHEDAQFLLSPKLDGVCCEIREAKYYDKTKSVERVISRNGKPIPNLFIRSVLEQLPVGCIGEIAPVDPTQKHAYQASVSAAMTIEGTPDNWKFWIFNFVDSGIYSDRMQRVKALINSLPISVSQFVEFVPQYAYVRTCTEDILLGMQEMVKQGYEGAMLTNTHSLYINRRTSFTKPDLLKLKPFKDAEAEIVGFIQGKYGTNLKTVPEELWGKGKEEIGALLLRSPDGLFRDFKCGTGFSAEQKRDFWQNQDAYLGQTVTYKYLSSGTDMRPRHPVFVRIRPEGDLPCA